MGREQIIEGVKKHNKFIISSAPYVTCHQHPKMIAFKELRQQRPGWLPTPYEEYQVKRGSDLMAKLIRESRACVDSSPPSLAWHHRKLQNQNRHLKLNDPVYWSTKGHEIQWSVTEAEQAKAAF